MRVVLGIAKVKLSTVARVMLVHKILPLTNQPLMHI